MSFFSRFRSPRRSDFDREVLPHLDALYRGALALTRNEKDAEDLVQDTALRAFRFFGSFEAGSNARAWLFKILHNTFVTRYRQKTREREVLDDVQREEEAGTAGTLGAPAIDAEEVLLAQLVGEDVRAALERIPEDFRAAVVLCDLEELSYKEIADIMGCPVGTVMSRLHRGRRLLKNELRAYAAERGIGLEKGEPSPKLARVIPLHGGKR